MKIAMHNPQFIFQNQVKNFNGYNFEFLKNYTDIIYLSKPWHIIKYIKKLKELGIDRKKYEFIFSISTLNQKADVLLSFNGVPYIKHVSPPKKFTGLKIWHTMDYVFKASESNKVLVDNGVDYVMGYTRHDLYCPFFQKYYADFKDKVLAVPFGYGERFINTKPFENRIKQCIALGSVNPVNDPLCTPGTLDDYTDFYKDEIWTHAFRRVLAENVDSLKDIMDSKLPSLDKTKNPNYNPVDELNKYIFFVNDEGLMNFPPARTYEGIASGSIMIASKNKIYEDLGFIDGVNYIGFDKNDLESFNLNTLKGITGEYNLKAMQEKSLELSKEFTHKQVAEKLYHDIKAIRKV